MKAGYDVLSFSILPTVAQLGMEEDSVWKLRELLEQSRASTSSAAAGGAVENILAKGEHHEERVDYEVSPRLY